MILKKVTQGLVKRFKYSRGKAVDKQAARRVAHEDNAQKSQPELRGRKGKKGTNSEKVQVISMMASCKEIYAYKEGAE